MTFKESLRERARAVLVVQHLLETVTLPGPLEDLTLTLADFAGERGQQASLFAEVRQHDQLREAIQQLAVRLGQPPPIYQVRELELWSNLPERRHALIPYAP